MTSPCYDEDDFDSDNGTLTVRPRTAYRLVNHTTNAGGRVEPLTDTATVNIFNLTSSWTNSTGQQAQAIVFWTLGTSTIAIQAKNRFYVRFNVGVAINTAATASTTLSQHGGGADIGNLPPANTYARYNVWQDTSPQTTHPAPGGVYTVPNGQNIQTRLECHVVRELWNSQTPHPDYWSEREFWATVEETAVSTYAWQTQP